MSQDCSTILSINVEGLTQPRTKTAKIAVIGGGYSGVYTAYRLKQLGFEDVTIFEKSGRVGGKCSTMYCMVG